MNFTIRQETLADHSQVFHLIQKAFANEKHSDHQEQFLVERLRNSNAFIPELSLVAEFENKIIGHLLLTRVVIKNGDRNFDSLALAPVSVLPDFQGKGVGSALIHEAHSQAALAGYNSIILLGHSGYYPKFGYRKASDYGLKLPFDVPDENCMAIELIKNGLKGVNGIVEYPKEFFE